MQALQIILVQRQNPVYHLSYFKE